MFLKWNVGREISKTLNPELPTVAVRNSEHDIKESSFGIEQQIIWWLRECGKTSCHNSFKYSWGRYLPRNIKSCYKDEVRI